MGRSGNTSPRGFSQPVMRLELDFAATAPSPIAGEPLPGGAYPLRVKAYCGCFVGEPKWQSTEIYEPDECQWSGEILVDGYEFAEGCVCVRCPECHADLHQADDHLEALEPVPSLDDEPAESSAAPAGMEREER